MTIVIGVISLSYESTIDATKKSSIPNIFFLALSKLAVIDKLVPALFESVGIGNPITTVFKSAGTRSQIALE